MLQAANSCIGNGASVVHLLILHGSRPHCRKVSNSDHPLHPKLVGRFRGSVPEWRKSLQVRKKHLKGVEAHGRGWRWHRQDGKSGRGGWHCATAARLRQAPSPFPAPVPLDRPPRMHFRKEPPTGPNQRGHHILSNREGVSIRKFRGVCRQKTPSRNLCRIDTSKRRNHFSS